jgi:hypothetical protein
MRDFRDAKAMARALRDALKAKAVETTHAEALELIAKAFGCENWNVLSAKIGAAEPAASDEGALSLAAQNNPPPPKTLYCSFCAKSQDEVAKLIAGPPPVLICDGCVDICTNVFEPDDDKELFRLMKANEESGSLDYPTLLELARGMPTEELAHYVERGSRGVKRNQAALRDALDNNNVPAVMQQKAQRELKQYEDVLSIATTVLGERRQ